MSKLTGKQRLEIIRVEAEVMNYGEYYFKGILQGMQFGLDHRREARETLGELSPDAAAAAKMLSDTLLEGP